MSIAKVEANANRPLESQEVQAEGQVENQQALSASTWTGMESSSMKGPSKGVEGEEFTAKRGLPEMGFPAVGVRFDNGNCTN